MTTIKKTQKKEASKPAAKKTVVNKTARKKETVKNATAKKDTAKNVVVKKEVAKKAAVKPQSSLNTIKIKPTQIDNNTPAPVVMKSDRPGNVAVPPLLNRKKRLVVSYSNMKEEVAAAFKEKYPRGYSDYMGDLFKVDKPDGTSFYAITLETEDSVYLIKMVVNIDRVEDAQKDLFPDSDGSDDIPTEGETFPDDNTDNMSDSEDDID